MGADIITCKKTGVINSSCISFQYASAMPLALYMLAHWRCLLAQQNGIKPSLMILVTPVIFLPWEKGFVPISNYSILLQTQLDSFWNENLTTNTQTVGQEATCQIIDGTHIHSFVLFGSSNLLLEVFTSRKTSIWVQKEGEMRLSSSHWLAHLAGAFKRNCGSQPARVKWSLLGFWLLRSQTPVTHLHSGGEMPDTEVVFVSESENYHLQGILLASFIYRHHPV